VRCRRRYLDGVTDEGTLGGGLEEALLAGRDEVGRDGASDGLVLEQHALARGQRLLLVFLEVLFLDGLDVTSDAGVLTL
jgi:hypothetical protein